MTTLHNPDYTFEDHGGPTFRIRKWLDRTTGHRRTTRFLAVSEAVRADYELHMGFQRIEVLHNYMEVAPFRDRLDALDRESERLRLGLRPDDVVFLHVGRFHRQKAQDVLLDAFRVARLEEPRLRLLLAGEGSTLPDARVRAEDLGLEDSVVFLGDVAEVEPLYRAADAFAFPSRWEAFGIALLEAMAAGLPAVVTNTGGIAEIATPATALFVDVDRVEELARALLTLARDPEGRERMGRAAARRSEDFDAAPWVSRLEEVYDAL